MNFTADLSFAIPDAKVWNYFRDPESDAELCTLYPEAKDLKRLVFVAQGRQIEFAADKSHTGLSAYLDEIGEVLKRNIGILKLAETMQVIYRPGAPVDFGKRIRAAVRAAEQS